MTDMIRASLPDANVPIEEKLKLMRSHIEYFSSVLMCDTLSESCAAGYKDMLNTELQNYITEVHHKKIFRISRIRKNGDCYYLWATDIAKNKRITASKLEDLYQKLFDFYTEGSSSTFFTTLEKQFPKFLRDKADYVSAKTVKEYKQVWEKYFAGSCIATTEVHALKTKDYRKHFVRICKTFQLTKKRFMDVKTVLSGLLSYCVEEEILVYNPIRDINYRKFPYADDISSSHVKSKAFTLSESQTFKDWCLEELKKPNIKKVYIYAMLFNLSISLRFAELAGLRWEDINFEENYMTISGQAVLQVEMHKDLTFSSHGRSRVNHVKSHEEPRLIPLLPEEIEILQKIKALDLSETFVFPQGDFRYHTYNDKVKKAAKEIGLDPSQYHTHCLRATAATNTYNACQDVRQVQMLLGHTTPEMTNRYIHNNRGLEVLRAARSTVMSNLVQ